MDTASVLRPVLNYSSVSEKIYWIWENFIVFLMAFGIILLILSTIILTCYMTSVECQFRDVQLKWAEPYHVTWDAACAGRHARIMSLQMQPVLGSLAVSCHLGRSVCWEAWPYPVTWDAACAGRHARIMSLQMQPVLGGLAVSCHLRPNVCCEAWQAVQWGQGAALVTLSDAPEIISTNTNTSQTFTYKVT